MTEDEFWRIVEEINLPGAGDMAAKERLLAQHLEGRDAEAVGAFGDHMDVMMDKAYSWPLWAAAYIIDGGCSDDAFMDFRSTLICMGRDIFEAACAAPDSLAKLDDDILEEMSHEGLLYVPSTIYQAKTGDDRPRRQQAPAEPHGEAWDEDDEDKLRALCPELYERFWE